MTRIVRVPRGSYLSDLEKGKILTFSGEGLSRREITQRLNRLRKVVANYLNNPTHYGTNKKGGPKKKISPRTERKMQAIV